MIPQHLRILVLILFSCAMNAQADADGPQASSSDSAQAATPVRKFQIQSKVDRFDVILDENAATVNGKAVDMAALRNTLPMILNPLADECPKLQSHSDVKVKVNGTVRQIYFAQGVVSDGKKCLIAQGEGLAFFPIHRDFLIGPKNESLTVTSPLKITRPDLRPLEFIQRDGIWDPVGEKLLVNWDFFERFENSLKNFTVRYRALSSITKDKPKMSLTMGSKTYDFYKISNVLWAVQKPGGHWLTASDDWGFWYDFEDGLLEDRFADSIRLLEDSSKELALRQSTLEKLEGQWSRNLRDVYHKIILDQEENPQLQEIAIRRLKGKPTMATALVMAKVLERTSNENFKRTASQILKLNYDKGPLYNPHASASERAKVVSFWSEWRKKREPTP